jgi:Asp-tRNA(Asn)/Glu-tRNA(Gln) amidotransferase A subunit family amidase
LSTEYAELDAVAIAEAVRTRDVSPVEIVTAALERIEAVEPSVNACSVVCAEEALADARALERRVAQGGEGDALAGVPVGDKDVIRVRGLPATMGTRALADFVPTSDASAVRRLREAGAIVVAKTTNPPLCDAGYTESELHGVTRNPWHLGRTPGGSSGGSGAAVAAGIVPLALGTDMGGSIRGPAAFCGIVGLKPTHGLVARGPCFEEGRTLNAVGPMARTVRDTALGLRVIAGADPADNLSISAPTYAITAGTDHTLRGAWSLELAGIEVDASVEKAFTRAIEALAVAGWQLERAEPRLLQTLSIHATIAAGERGIAVDWREDLLEPGLQQLLARASVLSAAEYHRAQLARAEYTRRLGEFLRDYDLLLTPTVCLPAFGADPKHLAQINGRPIDVDVDPWWEFCLPANLTGCPAISVPIGLTEDGLPLGLQIICPRFHDERCLAAAAEIETLMPWPRLPPLIAPSRLTPQVEPDSLIL